MASDHRYRLIAIGLYFIALASLVLADQGFYIIAISKTTDASRAFPDVQAVTTFDPYHRKDFYLRLTATSQTLPRFGIKNGGLFTDVVDQYWCNQGVKCIYTLLDPVDGDSVRLSSLAQSSGPVSIGDNSLLYIGDKMHWAICEGELGYMVVRAHARGRGV